MIHNQVPGYRIENSGLRGAAGPADDWWGGRW
jgi:hypothetical protein